jgi:hypothetical protein
VGRLKNHLALLKLILEGKQSNQSSYRGAMLAHCVNPNCCVPLHSLCEGRLFQFEVVSISIAASDDTAERFDEKPERQTAHFWLCGHCADSMTLVLEPVRGLRVVPLASGNAELPDVTEVSLVGLELQQTNNC